MVSFIILYSIYLPSQTRSAFSTNSGKQIEQTLGARHSAQLSTSQIAEIRDSIELALRLVSTEKCRAQIHVLSPFILLCKIIGLPKNMCLNQ